MNFNYKMFRPFTRIVTKRVPHGFTRQLSRKSVHRPKPKSHPNDKINFDYSMIEAFFILTVAGGVGYAIGFIRQKSDTPD